MDLTQAELFLGIQVDSILEASLEKIDPKIVNLYINADPEHLKKLEFADKQYIGKGLGEMADSATVLLMATHIVSVIKKLIPDYHLDINSLVVIPIPH